MKDPKKNAITNAEESAEISNQEKNLLNESIDNNKMGSAMLDNTDEDGIALNEDTTDTSGDDLDIPGAELDDENEEIGEEDEENNGYSQADTE
jgi:hypothetical protein